MKMNKPLTMIIRDVQINLAKTCNESGLPPIILDLIVKNIYSEIHSLAEKQMIEDEVAYGNIVKDKNANSVSLNLEGDINEQKEKE